MKCLILILTYLILNNEIHNFSTVIQYYNIISSINVVLGLLILLYCCYDGESVKAEGIGTGDWTSLTC